MFFTACAMKLWGRMASKYSAIEVVRRYCASLSQPRLTYANSNASLFRQRRIQLTCATPSQTA